MKVLLFGMTGFGNNALKALAEHPLVEIAGVFTPKKQNTPFPYYECEQLQDVVKKNGIILYEDIRLKEEKAIKLIASLCSDLIVVCSFFQIIPESIISIPKLGVINIHPSLLPKYRGATPTAWVLINDEEETGVTVHFIEDEKVDSGRIITQAKLRIEPTDTDGSIRFKLANLSEKVLTDALALILTKDKGMFPLQNESQATYYPKRTLNDAKINLDRPFKDIQNRIRAMSPYPGARLDYNGKQYIVKNATFLNNKPSDDLYEADNKELIVNTLEGMVKFYVEKEEKNE